jgi:hypothetical protein
MRPNRRLPSASYHAGADGGQGQGNLPYLAQFAKFCLPGGLGFGVYSAAKGLFQGPGKLSPLRRCRMACIYDLVKKQTTCQVDTHQTVLEVVRVMV